MTQFPCIYIKQLLYFKYMLLLLWQIPKGVYPGSASRLDDYKDRTLQTFIVKYFWLTWPIQWHISKLVLSVVVFLVRLCLKKSGWERLSGNWMNNIRFDQYLLLTCDLIKLKMVKMVSPYDLFMLHIWPVRFTYQTWKYIQYPSIYDTDCTCVHMFDKAVYCFW